MKSVNGWKKCSIRTGCTNSNKNKNGLLEISFFGKDAHLKDGLNSNCKHCNAEKYRRLRKENPDPYRKASLRYWSRNSIKLNAHKKEYCRKNPDNRKNTILKNERGITLEEYKLLLRRQNGACAICGEQPLKRSLAVDHNHITGKIRGLLCFRCNSSLGKFKTDSLGIQLLEKAIKYMRKYK